MGVQFGASGCTELVAWWLVIYVNVYVHNYYILHEELLLKTRYAQFQKISLKYQCQVQRLCFSGGFHICINMRIYVHISEERFSKT